MPPDNHRSLRGSDRIVNYHYFLKRPVVMSYFPNFHPPLEAIRTQTGLATLGTFFTAEDDPSLPLNVAFQRFDLRSCVATIDIPAGVTRLLWNSPFSPGWRATIDGRPVEVLRAANGLTQFDVTAGRREIQLIYHPWYLEWSLALCVVCWVTAAAWATWALMPAGRRHSRSAMSAAVSR